jgi:hypothetical protein
MDVAGAAALLGALVAMITALTGPLRDRALSSRLSRVEKHLAEGTTAGETRAMLESARDHLAERIAIIELRPRYRPGWIMVGCLLVLGVTLLVIVNLPDAGSELNYLTVYATIGWICYFGGVAGFSIIRGKQALWLEGHRDTAYRRDSNPLR